jgi:hypothetical protein
MKRYLLSVMQPQGGPPPREFLEKVMRDLAAVNREMKAAGARVFAGGLQPLSVAKVARLKDGEILISDGPFAETKEFLGGISIIAAPNLEAAAEWAGKVARATTLPIEVRPFQDGAEG